MKAIAILMLMLTAGCYGAPFSPAETCRMDGMTVYVEGSWQIGGKAIAGCDWYYGLVTQAVVFDMELDQPAGGYPFPEFPNVPKGQPVPGAAMFKITQGLDIWVHATNGSLICEGVEENEIGCNDDMHKIEVGASAGELAHELLHSYEAVLGVPMEDRMNHVGWVERGWMPDTNAFREASVEAFDTRYCPQDGTCG